MTNQCEIVQDLLPLYVDHELSQESVKFVDSHLNDCNVCIAAKKEILRSKQLDIKIHKPLKGNNRPSPQELEFIQRVTKWKRNSAIFGICFILLLSFLLWALTKDKLEPQPVDKEIPSDQETTFHVKESSQRWGNYDFTTTSNHFNYC